MSVTPNPRDLSIAQEIHWYDSKGDARMRRFLTDSATGEWIGRDSDPVLYNLADYLAMRARSDGRR